MPVHHCLRESLFVLHLRLVVVVAVVVELLKLLSVEVVEESQSPTPVAQNQNY